MTEKRSRQPWNPLNYPADYCPKIILKAKNGAFHFLETEPSADKSYLWYMTETKLVTMDALEQEMKVPDRRWFATDKAAYALQQTTDASTTEGTPYVCLRNIHDPSMYFFGKRHVEPPVQKTVLMLTVAELFLKSELHQKRLVRILIEQVRRVLCNPQVYRYGSTMIEVRKTDPTPEQIQILSLVPGIAKIYSAKEGPRDGDLRGPLLKDGAGGVPILPENRALALISGGIDSPVAAYRMMTRGCTVSGIHFLNSTNDTAAVMSKNRQIGERLSQIQGRFDMYYVDISKLQTQIVANVQNSNRTLIYKWFMLALAAGFDDSKFIVVGDSAGQVASQTVANISTLYPTISKAVIAPLVGLEKNMIIDQARKIDTFNLSIMEGADCCQYMMCKTGANLCMGRRTLEACVRRVKLSELPVHKEIYRQGQLCETTEFSFFPTAELRSAAGGVATSRRGGGQGERTNTTNDSAPPLGKQGDEEVVYFDAAAGTLMPETIKLAMLHAPEGNPNSMHASGREARMAIEKVRMQIADAIGVPVTDIVFTSGGTESNNIALHGYKVLREDWSHASTSQAPNVADDAQVVRVVDLVNHETGSINRNLRRPSGGRLHVDASQAFTKIDFKTLDLSEVDSMTVTAHKINGPVGCAALYLRNLECHRMYAGGSQEKGVRPGTENVTGIVGFGAALRLDRSASAHKEIDAYMVEELKTMGCDVNRRGETSGFVVHATLPEGYNNTEVVSMLSSKFNVEIGTGSACKTGEVNTTVYDTLGKTPEPTRSIRLSWDSFNTMHDAERVVEALQKTLTLLKK